MHGQFTWYELTTPDVAAAMKFYPRFTGWGTLPFDSDYMMFTRDNVPVAGIFRMTDEMRAQGIPPNWMPYVESDDVDATATRAKSLGAQVLVGPGDIPGTGRFAVVQDPQGAVFGVYKASGPSMAWDGTNVVGRFSWHELMTTDYQTAAQFYGALFGWESMGEMDMGGGQMYRLFGKNGKMYGGMYNKMPGMEAMHPFWLCYIHVEDVPTAFATATKAGAAVHRPPMDIPDGVIAILGDPQGAGFALHHSNKPVARAKAAAKKAATAAATAARKAAKKVKKAAAKVATAVRTKVAKKPAKRPAKTSARKAAKAAARTKAKRPARAKTRTTRRSATKAPTRAKRATRARPAARKATARKSGGARKPSARKK